MAELRSLYLFTISMKLPPTLDLGDTPSGNRRVFTVSGGRFAGDRLRGEVLPEASSDLLLVRGDGSCQQDVRLILRTDDTALILMTVVSATLRLRLVRRSLGASKLLHLIT